MVKCRYRGTVCLSSALLSCPDSLNMFVSLTQTFRTPPCLLLQPVSQSHSSLHRNTDTQHPAHTSGLTYLWGPNWQNASLNEWTTNNLNLTLTPQFETKNSSSTFPNWLHFPKCHFDEIIPTSLKNVKLSKMPNIWLMYPIIPSDSNADKNVHSHTLEGWALVLQDYLLL